MNKRSTPSLLSVLSEAVRGKSVGRTLTNLYWRGSEPLAGSVLDIGGAGRGSHYRFIPIKPGTAVRVADIMKGPGTDFVLDITKQRVPLPDGSQDAVFLFNILEHVNDHAAVLAEVRRLLKPGGRLLGSIPFLVNVHPNPNDYIRFTAQALQELFTKAGFSVRAIVPIGHGPFLAAYEQLDSIVPSFLHGFFLPCVWLADSVVAKARPNRDFTAKFPLAYNFEVEKS